MCVCVRDISAILKISRRLAHPSVNHYISRVESRLLIFTFRPQAHVAPKYFLAMRIADVIRQIITNGSLIAINLYSSRAVGRRKEAKDMSVCAQYQEFLNAISIRNQ